GDAEHKQVVWESDNKQIAEVVPTSQIATLADDNLPQHHFTILCKKPGTARLTAVAADGGTGFASFPVTINQPEVVSVPAKQIVLEDKQVLYTTNFWFELHKDGTAALVHPSAGTDNPLTENGIPSTPYNFDYPGEEFITTYRRMLWSPLMDSLQYVNRDLYFTALKVPGEITVSGKKYEVTAVGDYAFAGSNVKCINIPRTVKSIGDYAFKDAKKYVGFTDVTHYEVIHDGVESLGKGIFSGCSQLRNMRFGHGIVEIPEETFDGCTSLRSISIGRNVEKINCSFNQPNLNSIAFSGHVPPVFAEGCSVKTINNNISTNVSSVDEYKAAFPEFNVSAPSIEIASVSRSKAYVGDDVMFKYKRISNGVCEYMEFYPAGVNAEGMAYGGFTHSGTTSSNDWLILKFDDLSAIYDATSISSASATFYITFAKTGLHKVYINPMQNPDLEPTVVEVEIVPGTPVKDIVINDPPLYMDIDEVRRINVKVLPENASDKSIRWVVTGDDGIIEINEKNEIKAKAIGSVVVRAVSTDTVGPTRVSPQFTVRVIQSVKEVVVKTGETVVPNTGITGYVGDKINLNASFLPENCEYNTCSWSATPDAILKVEGEDKNAVLQLTGAGRGVLSVNVSQLTGLTALRRDIPVLALMPVNSIRVTKDGAEINPGEPIVGDIGSVYLLTATPNADAYKKDLEWSISNPDIIDLIRDGDKVRIVLKAIGTAYLRIKATDDRNYEIVIPIGVKEPGEPDPEIPFEIKVDRIEIQPNSIVGY
ncbi:MAG: leucine-rich repeat domain-containing protein, partial [Paramuribaculum sp.]|nr:leucine-rich repeat domain-containing protein [Paramuribaculum sp.]